MNTYTVKPMEVSVGKLNTLPIFIMAIAGLVFAYVMAPYIFFFYSSEIDDEILKGLDKLTLMSLVTALGYIFLMAQYQISGVKSFFGKKVIILDDWDIPINEGVSSFLKLVTTILLAIVIVTALIEIAVLVAELKFIGAVIACILVIGSHRLSSYLRDYFIDTWLGDITEQLNSHYANEYNHAVLTILPTLRDKFKTDRGEFDRHIASLISGDSYYVLSRRIDHINAINEFFECMPGTESEGNWFHTAVCKELEDYAVVECNTTQLMRTVMYIESEYTIRKICKVYKQIAAEQPLTK